MSFIDDGKYTHLVGSDLGEHIGVYFLQHEATDCHHEFWCCEIGEPQDVRLFKDRFETSRIRILGKHTGLEQRLDAEIEIANISAEASSSPFVEWSRRIEKCGGNVRNLNLRVQPLFETGVFPENPDPRGFEAVLEETHVLRLSNLATPELMVAVSRFVLQKIYADMLAKGPTHEMRVFAVVDEAHKLSYEETLTELIREARKYGVGVLLASQSVKDFDRVVFDMVGTEDRPPVGGRRREGHGRESRTGRQAANATSPGSSF